jgi:FAD/FMN-containing dehydrogenase
LKQIAVGAPTGGIGSPEPFPLTYAALYSQSLTGDAQRTAADTIWTDDPVWASDILADHVACAPSDGSVGIVNFRGEGVLPEDAACSMIGRGFLQWIGQWSDPAADPENFAWTEAVADALLPVTKGCYVNETDILRRPQRLPMCFSESAWARLQVVRETYDPDGRFPPPPPDAR